MRANRKRSDFEVCRGARLVEEGRRRGQLASQAEGNRELTLGYSVEGTQSCLVLRSRDLVQSAEAFPCSNPRCPLKPSKKFRVLDSFTVQSTACNFHREPAAPSHVIGK